MLLRYIRRKTAACKFIETHLSFQSVLGQRDDFSDVGLLVTLPSASQLNFGAVEEGIAHCAPRDSQRPNTI